MNRFLAILMSLSFLCAGLGLAASPPLMISDQVKGVSLSGDGKVYAVVFEQHPAAYHVSAKSKAMKCLLASMREKRQGFIWVDPKNLVIRKCDLPPKK